MKFFFLRHTSLDVKKDIFYGQTDLDVSNSFSNELKLIKKKIKTERISFSNFVVYSSPLKRCLKLAKSLHKEIHIDDFGVGIEPEDLKQLTTPFQRGSNTGLIKGSGIGLAIATTIAEQHGGRLEFSKWEFGIRATLVLPR